MISEEKKQWLSVRRSTLTDYYDLPADKAEQAEQMFRQMEELAETCADQGEFEQKMLNSPLQQDYVGFVAACAPFVKKPAAAQSPDRSETMKSAAADVASREATIAAKRLLNEYVPIDGYNWSEPWWYAIPILGPIFRRIADARNEMDQVKRFTNVKKPGED